jgi:ABC-type spermidine/putrescine transport system permease subunit II
MSVCLGFFAALALQRHSFSGKSIVRIILLIPLIVPTIVVATAVYSLYVKLHLVGTVAGIVLAHTVLVMPFTVMLLTAGLERLDRRLEEASYTMGATTWQTFRRITLPILGPNLFAAAVFAFVFSFDEVVMVIFVGGLIGETLPLKMFTFMQTEITPLLAAVSTLLLLFVAIVQTSLALVSGRKSRAGARGNPRSESGQVRIAPTRTLRTESADLDHTA